MRMMLVGLFLGLYGKLLVAMNDKPVAGPQEVYELIEAAKNNGVELVKSLLREYMFPDSDSEDYCYTNNDTTSQSSAIMCAFCEAAKHGHLQVVKLFGLFDASLMVVDSDGTNLRFCEKAGQAALINAASNGHADIVEFLLDGDPVLACSVAGYTALKMALKNGYHDVVNVLTKVMLLSGIINNNIQRKASPAMKKSLVI